MKRFTNALAATLFAGAIGVVGLSGQASAQPAGGTERFTIIVTSGTGGRVIATGAFTAVGTVTLPLSDDPGGTATMTFPGGTIATTATERGGQASFDPVACVGRVSSTGTYVIDGGTGVYSGISGHGTYDLGLTVITGRTPNGCSETPIAVAGVSRSGGPVSFS
jgi:hypothetical protein